MKNSGKSGVAVEWWIWSRRRVGPKLLHRLEEVLEGDFGRLLSRESVENDRLMAACGAPACLRRLVRDGHLEGALDEYRREVLSLPSGCCLLHREDSTYPSRLLRLDRPPRFLYVRGQLNSMASRRSVAIVGSRRAGVEAVRESRVMAECAAQEGFTVVSGGAIGVDAAAHQGAIREGGRTIVVLPGGIDRPTPKKNRSVFGSALVRGCWISEYPLGSGVRKYHFHRRNHLIAALGDRLIVVRAGVSSGTMITARAAMALGRPVFALVGARGGPRAEGCRWLVERGAVGVEAAGDFRRWIDREPSVRGVQSAQIDVFDAPPGSIAGEAGLIRLEQPRAQLGLDGQRVLEAWRAAAVCDETMHVDELARCWVGTQDELHLGLLELELAGYIEKAPGQNAYRLGRDPDHGVV